MVTSWSVSLEKPGVQPWPLLQACELLLESSQPSFQIPSWGSPGPLPPTEDGAPQCLGDDVYKTQTNRKHGLHVDGPSWTDLLGRLDPKVAT